MSLCVLLRFRAHAVRQSLDGEPDHKTDMGELVPHRSPNYLFAIRGKRKLAVTLSCFGGDARLVKILELDVIVPDVLD